MFAQLPPELLDAISAHLSSDAQSLKALALVSPRTTPPAQSRLFSKVVLACAHLTPSPSTHARPHSPLTARTPAPALSPAFSRFVALVSSNPGIAAFVHELVLASDARDGLVPGPALLSLLTLLPRLRRLTVHNPLAWTQDPASSPSSRRLAHHPATPAPQLTSLTVLSTKPFLDRTRSAPSLQPLVPPNSLASPLDLSALTALDVHFACATELDAVLTQCARTLEHLCIRYTRARACLLDPQTPPPRTPSLSTLTSLASLHIVTRLLPHLLREPRADPLGWIRTALSSLPPEAHATLAHVRFTFQICSAVSWFAFRDWCYGYSDDNDDHTPPPPRDCTPLSDSPHHPANFRSLAALLARLPRLRSITLECTHMDSHMERCYDDDDDGLHPEIYSDVFRRALLTHFSALTCHVNIF